MRSRWNFTSGVRKLSVRLPRYWSWLFDDQYSRFNTTSACEIETDRLNGYRQYRILYRSVVLARDDQMTTLLTYLLGSREPSVFTCSLMLDRRRFSTVKKIMIHVLLVSLIVRRQRINNHGDIPCRPTLVQMVQEFQAAKVVSALLDLKPSFVSILTVS